MVSIIIEGINRLDHSTQSYFKLLTSSHSVSILVQIGPHNITDGPGVLTFLITNVCMYVCVRVCVRVHLIVP